MTCTRDRRLVKAARGPVAFALAIVAPAAVALAGAPSFASIEQAAELVARARQAIAAGDGIAAEVHLKQAMAKGAAREAVAAYMGEALIAQGEGRRARAWLTPGIFTRKTAPLGFRTLARLEQMDGNLVAAGAAFDRVIALTPKDPTLWVEIAHLRYAGGEHMLAFDAANYAMQLDPTNVRVLELRGEIVRDQHGLRAALPWFEAALARAPEDASVLGEYAATLGDLGRAKDALATTRRLLAADPGNPRAFYLQAVLAARAGNLALARRLMDRVGDRLEGIPAVTLLRGVLEMHAGNYVLATEAFEELARRQPDNAKVKNLLLRALFLSGEYRQLVIRFAPAAAERSASAYALTVLARSHEALGARALAAPLLDRAALAQNAPVPAASMGAGDATDQVLPADPGNFDAQLRAGDARLAVGDGAEALDRYRLAARIRLPEALMLRMVAAYDAAGQKDDAARLIESFLAQNPRSDPAARLAADLAARSGDWRRSRLLLEKVAANGAGRDVRILTDLAIARLRAGDARAAQTSAREAFRLQPSSPYAAQAWALSLATLGQEPRVAQALLDKARLLVGDGPLIAEARMKLSAKPKG